MAVLIQDEEGLIRCKNVDCEKFSRLSSWTSNPSNADGVPLKQIHCNSSSLLLQVKLILVAHLTPNGGPFLFWSQIRS